MKTIFITSFHQHTSRNILQAGVLRLILDSGARVVLLVPIAKVEYFTKTFVGRNVSIEGVSIPKKVFEGMVMLFAFGLFNIKNRVVRDWKNKGWWHLYGAVIVINGTFAHLPITRIWLRDIASHYLVTRAIDPLIEKYKPDLVVTTDSFHRDDRAVCITAKKRGIKTVAMIRSWDNATTKGVFLCNPDHITVPTAVLKDELVAIHRVREGIITVTGWPHYDSVLAGSHVSRAQFFTKMGLNPKLKTILFAPGGEILYKHDREVLTMLKRLLDSGSFSYPVQFLVRLPPSDIVDTSPVDGDARFIIDVPGTNVTGRRKENEMSPDDNAHLEDTLRHVDMVLTLVSTMAIDGAVFGKPVVIIGFDAPGATRQSVRSFAVRLHFRKFLNFGLLTVPRSEDEFVESVNAYLKDPSLHTRERAEIVSRYAHALDGKSAKRVAETVLRELE